MENWMVETQNLRKYYQLGTNTVKALDGVNFRVKEQEFVAIIGKSGSGKSTLLHMLGGLDTPSEGEVCIAGKNIAGMNREELTIFRRRKVGFIFQSYNLVQDLNVYENIVLPIRLDGKRVDRDFVEEIMQLLQINDKKQALPGTLSGGQQQRVAIARALAAKPQIILADEPTGALDSRSGIQVMNLFQQLNEEGVTIIMITHDANIANHAKKVLHIFDGEIVEDKERKEKQQAEVQSEKEAKNDTVFSEIEQDFGVKEWEGEI